LDSHLPEEDFDELSASSKVRLGVPGAQQICNQRFKRMSLGLLNFICFGHFFYWFSVCRLFGRKLSSTQGVSLKMLLKKNTSKIQQTKHRQAVFICVSIASCRVFARVSPLHKRIIVQACGCKHSGVFNSHPTFFRFFLRCQEFH